jgi:hypothetical protein
MSGGKTLGLRSFRLAKGARLQDGELSRLWSYLSEWRMK